MSLLHRRHHLTNATHPSFFLAFASIPPSSSSLRSGAPSSASSSYSPARSAAFFPLCHIWWMLHVLYISRIERSHTGRGRVLHYQMTILSSKDLKNLPNRVVSTQNVVAKSVRRVPLKDTSCRTDSFPLKLISHDDHIRPCG